jgi:hypothetical protein
MRPFLTVLADAQIGQAGMSGNHEQEFLLLYHYMFGTTSASSFTSYPQRKHSRYGFEPDFFSGLNDVEPEAATSGTGCGPIAFLDAHDKIALVFF